MAEYERKPSVRFEPNISQPLTFAFDGGLERDTKYGVKTLYTLQDDRILWADKDLACKINFCDPKRGETLWVMRRVQELRGSKRKKYASSWHVSRQEPGTIQRGTDQSGLEESELERECRESVEITQRAADNIRAKLNLETRGDATVAPKADPSSSGDSVKPGAATHGSLGSTAGAAPDGSLHTREQGSISAAVDGCLALDAPAIARKPVSVEKASQPPTQLEHALKTVLYACKQAVAYAKEIEFQAPPFTSDDISKMAMTLIIGERDAR